MQVNRLKKVTAAVFLNLLRFLFFRKKLINPEEVVEEEEEEEAEDEEEEVEEASVMLQVVVVEEEEEEENVVLGVFSEEAVVHLPQVMSTKNFEFKPILLFATFVLAKSTVRLPFLLH